MNLSRQMDILSPDKCATPITIVGAGATGGATALILAKMGCGNLTVYDPDTVETVNIPNQWHRPADVGRLKVDALRDVVRDMTSAEITAAPSMWNGAPIRGVLILCPDNMPTRKAAWQANRLNPGCSLYLDTRMGAEQGWVLAPERGAGWYEKMLWEDTTIPREPCTAKAIMFTATAIGSIAAGMVKNFLMGQPFSRRMALDFRGWEITHVS